MRRSRWCPYTRLIVGLETHGLQRLLPMHERTYVYTKTNVISSPKTLSISHCLPRNEDYKSVRTSNVGSNIKGSLKRI